MNSVGPYEAVALYKSVPYMCVYERARARAFVYVGRCSRAHRQKHARSVYFTHERACISSGANRLPMVSFFLLPTELCS